MDELKKQLRLKNAAYLYKRGDINLMQYFDLIRHLLTIVLIFNMIGCAKDSGSSSPAPTIPLPTNYSCAELTGTYDNAYVAGSVLVITNTCNLTESACGYNGTFTQPNRTTGATVFTINGTNGTAGCMSSTPHPCKIELRGFQLGISCDNATETAVFNRR